MQPEEVSTEDEYATFESTTGLVQKKPIPSSLKAKAVVLGFLLLAIGAFVGQKASQALAEPLELTDVAAEGVQAWDPANCPGDSPNPLTCWADEAYQKCGPTRDERQGAYAAVMAKAPDQAAMFAEHNSCGTKLSFGLTTNPNSGGCKLIVTVDSQATEFTFQGASQVDKSVSLTDWPTTVKFEMDPDGVTHYDNCRIVAPRLIGGTNTFDFVAQFDSAAVTTQKGGNVKQGAADGSVFQLESGTIISTHPPWKGDTRGGTVSGSWHTGTITEEYCESQAMDLCPSTGTCTWDCSNNYGTGGCPGYPETTPGVYASCRAEVGASATSASATS